jgi:hypothetical protein
MTKSEMNLLYESIKHIPDDIKMQTDSACSAGWYIELANGRVLLLGCIDDDAYGEDVEYVGLNAQLIDLPGGLKKYKRDCAARLQALHPTWTLEKAEEML